MTKKDFEEWVRILNKKENMVFDGLFSTVLERIM